MAGAFIITRSKHYSDGDIGTETVVIIASKDTKGSANFKHVAVPWTSLGGG